MFNLFSNHENKITNILVQNWDHSDHQPVLSLILRPIKLCIVVIILIKLLHHSLLEPGISRPMLSRVLIKGPGVQQLVFIIRALLRPIIWAESKTCKQTSREDQHKILITIMGHLYLSLSSPGQDHHHHSSLGKSFPHHLHLDIHSFRYLLHLSLHHLRT